MTPFPQWYGVESLQRREGFGALQLATPAGDVQG